MATETYNISAFPNGLDIPYLFEEITVSSITAKLRTIYQQVDTVYIIFNTGLSAPEKTTLDTIVANHNPNDKPLQSPGNIYEYSEQQPVGTNGGTFTAGAWQIRTLNTSSTTSGLNPNSSLSSNQIILNPGTWYMRAICPAFCVGDNTARLYDANGATAFAIGQVTDSGVLPDGSTTKAIVEHTATFGSTAAVEVQHQCANTVDNVGFGKATGFGTEVYTTVFVQEYI